MSPTTVRADSSSVIPIVPLRWTQAPHDATGAHPWYLRAGAAVMRADRQRLVQNPSPGTSGAGPVRAESRADGAGA